jgi:transcriptional regulator with XRE-family HTH domain
MSARWHLLGPELRAAREATGATLRETARRLSLSPSTLSLAERCGPVLGRTMLLELAEHYGTGKAVATRWLALAGHLPADLESALLDHPERWDDVLALLGKPPVGGVR